MVATDEEEAREREKQYAARVKQLEGDLQRRQESYIRRERAYKVSHGPHSQPAVQRRVAADDWGEGGEGKCGSGSSAMANRTLALV